MFFHEMTYPLNGRNVLLTIGTVLQVFTDVRGNLLRVIHVIHDLFLCLFTVQFEHLARAIFTCLNHPFTD